MGPLLVGAAADTILGFAQASYNNSLAEQSAENAYERQLDFWNKQNSYNSPVNQRKRLEQAGFNPAAALGEVATGQNAQQLSSVPQNEYAQKGVLQLQTLSSALESFARIEKLGAETGLATQQIATEALKQILTGVGISEAKIDYALKYNKLEEDNATLEQRISHSLTMYDLEEQAKQADIDYKDALTSLANADSEESQANAEKLVAEKGLIAIRADTEKSMQAYNYALAKESNSKKELNEWELRKSMVLAPLQRKALELANDVKASEEQKNQVEAALKELELEANSNDETGEANFWYYFDHTMDNIATVLGIAAGVYVGTKSGVPKGRKIGY